MSDEGIRKLAATQHNLEALIEHYDAQLKQDPLISGSARALGDKLPDINWYEVFTKFIASATQIVSTVNASPNDRRGAVIEAAVQFWRQSLSPLVADAVKMPWVFNTFVAPSIEQQIPILAGGLYDALASVFARLVPVQSPAGVVPAESTTGTVFSPY